MRKNYDIKSKKGFNIFTNMGKRKIEENRRNPQYKPSKQELLFSQTGIPSERRLAPTFVRDIANFLGDPGLVKNISGFNDTEYIIEDEMQRKYNLEELHWFDDFVDAEGVAYPYLGILYFKNGEDELKILAVLEQNGNVLHYYKLDEGIVDTELIQKAFRDKQDVFVINAMGKIKRRSKKSKRSKSKRSKTKRSKTKRSKR